MRPGSGRQSRLSLYALAGTLLIGGSARAAESTGWGGWYGWQLALADAAAAGLALAPVDLSWRGAPVTIGMSGLFINGSIVHMVHGNPTAASRSLLRLPAFLLGRLAGFGAGELFCQKAGCKAPLLTAGSIVGLSAVVILDLLDAFEPPPWWLPDTRPKDAPSGPFSPLADHRSPPRLAGLPPPALTLPVAAGRF
jgi:hypothetical protein